MIHDWPATWSSRPWREEVRGWAQTCLAGHGIQILEAGPQRIRFWSTQVRFETSAGPVWLKENAPSQSFEAALVSLVGRLRPDAVPRVLGVDPEHGRLLTTHAGAPLAEAERSDLRQRSTWLAQALVVFAELQQQLSARVDLVRETGVPALPESTAIAHAVTIADALAALPPGDARRLDTDARRLVDTGLGRLGEAAAELEASRLPDSLDHNDLHLGNVLLGEGGPRLIDFADAVWAHPLTTLAIPLDTFAAVEELPEGSPEVGRILDMALEPWTHTLTSAALRDLLPAARRLSCLHRAQSWFRLMNEAPLECIDERHRPATSAWLLRACSA